MKGKKEIRKGANTFHSTLPALFQRGKNCAVHMNELCLYKCVLLSYWTVVSHVDLFCCTLFSLVGLVAVNICV